VLRRFPFRAMASPCELHLYGPEDQVRDAAAAAIAEVARIEAKYSRYQSDSLASAINRSAGDPRGIAVDPETAGLLDYAETAWRQSDGLFDVTSGVLREVWDFRSGRIPAKHEVDAVRRRVGWSKLRWRPPHLVLPLAGMQLDFGGFVKEYAADRVAELCRRRGARHGLVDLGGDLAIVGPHPDGRAWRVGVRDPRSPRRALGTLPVGWGGVATSGDYERGMTASGVRYGHILDPRTGWPVRGLAAVTVVAPHCLVAGTLTTMAMLRGEAGGAWLDASGANGLWVTESGCVGGSLAPRAAAA
jgi:thiamine biosynthesis lipoprotein